MHKVGGTSRAELTCGTRRTGSVETDSDHVIKGNARQIRGDLETICDLLQTDFWSLLRKRGMLAQSLDEKLLVPIHQCIVNGGSAKVHTSHYFHGLCPLFSMLPLLSLTEFAPNGLPGAALRFRLTDLDHQFV